MHSLVYYSIASPMLTEKDVDAILRKARDFNSVREITGCLLYFNDQFVQILEGQKSHILELYERIKHDKRHLNPTVIVETEIEDRVFPTWSMAYQQLNDVDRGRFNQIEEVREFINFSDLKHQSKGSIGIFWRASAEVLNFAQ